MLGAVRALLDTGALIAVESRRQSIWALHVTAQPGLRDLVIPTPVLTQVWRGGARQALLAKFLARCILDPPSAEVARRAGELLGRSGTRDAVDALVVATAVAWKADVIFTSDPGDIKALCEVIDGPWTPTIEHV